MANRKPVTSATNEEFAEVAADMVKSTRPVGSAKQAPASGNVGRPDSNGLDSIRDLASDPIVGYAVGEFDIGAMSDVGALSLAVRLLVGERLRVFDNLYGVTDQLTKRAKFRQLMCEVAWPRCPKCGAEAMSGLVRSGMHALAERPRITQLLAGPLYCGCGWRKP